MSVKKAIIKQVRDITLAAKSDSNHWVIMDGKDAAGGAGAASSPKELFLIALGGCTSMDVIPMLKKKRVHLVGYELSLTGNAREEHPQVFTDIHIEYVFYGDDISGSDVEHAIGLSTTKYCSVSAMVRESVKITHSYIIKPAAELA